MSKALSKGQKLSKSQRDAQAAAKYLGKDTSTSAKGIDRLVKLGQQSSSAIWSNETAYQALQPARRPRSNATAQARGGQGKGSISCYPAHDAHASAERQGTIVHEGHHLYGLRVKGIYGPDAAMAHVTKYGSEAAFELADNITCALGFEC